jgi:hypothetical protein
MIAAATLLMAALLSAPGPQPIAETCIAGWSDEGGVPQTAQVVLTLSGTEPLDRSALPDRTSGIVCPRASIVPLPDDVRVLSELGVSFGVMDEAGRSLWIWARAGRLRTMVRNGRLIRSESAALRRWSVIAQRRFAEALARN